VTRALVTGGAGFIGSHLVDRLLARGDEVTVLDNLSTGLRDHVAAGAALHVGDVRDPFAVAASMAGAEAVYHLAAQIDVRRSVEDPAYDARINVAGTAMVLEAARNAGVQRVVLASSGGAIYGDAETVPTPETAPVRPQSPYGVAKAAAEAYLQLYTRLYALPTIALRLANVYGPRQGARGEAGVIARWCGASAAGAPVTVFGDGQQTRDFVYVADAVEAFVAAADGDADEPCNIGTGTETSLLDLVAALGLDPGFAAPRAGEVHRSCLDPARAAERLGWTARTPLAQGLALTADHSTVTVLARLRG